MKKMWRKCFWKIDWKTDSQSTKFGRANFWQSSWKIETAAHETDVGALSLIRDIMKKLLEEKP